MKEKKHKDEKKTSKKENFVKEEELAAKEKKEECPSSQENPSEREIEDLKEKINQLNDRHLRVVAEYDNFRKRTAIEKKDLLLYGTEKIINELLPVIDDLELAMQNVRMSENIEALKQGVELILEKFSTFLQKQGVKPLDVIGQPFDTTSQQAVALVPVEDSKQKGKVIDCTKKGYMLHDKVLRFADVVVGE